MARFVAEELGGTTDHAELSRRYAIAAADLKRRKESYVIRIGELNIGMGRHRALLMKWLSDICELPCRMLRGEFYLGKTVHGEISVWGTSNMGLNLRGVSLFTSPHS